MTDNINIDKMRQTMQWLSLITLLLIYSCSSKVATQAPVSLTWINGGYNSQTEYYDNVFIIKNISEKPIDKDWVLYFSQLPREIKSVQTDEINLEVVNANYFKLSPTDNFKGLAPGDSIIIRYAVNNNTPNVSQQPEGCYWVAINNGKEGIPVATELNTIPLSDDLQMKYSTPERLYEFNKILNSQSVSLSQIDILPSVKHVEEKEGVLLIPSEFSLLYGNELVNEAGILKSKLAELYNIGISEVAPVSIRLNLLLTDDSSISNEEWYRLSIATNQIVIEGVTSHGVFNGIQTLLSLMKGQERPDHLKNGIITDYPDLPYRGFMLDIARNFTTASNLKTVIDLLSSYKINVLHLHFSDDEGWRLEIPGIEELTEVGGRRGHTLDEAKNLFPAYDGGHDANASTSGNGYYTRSEFIDLIKYAEDRHVRILPEVESPGHARAAIVAMKARYSKYIGTDKVKASEYLLSEAQDTSVYVSAQSYTDNVMNVSLPSTYRFMEKVITEIKNMYAEAGVALPSIHIGGDEVPSGSWMGSPSCQAFMKENKLSNTHDLFEYFYTQVTSYMQDKGIKFSGWQEVALHNSAKTDKLLSPIADGIYCWSTIAEWGDDEIPYHIANKGYPIILCNVNNFYLDLAYSAHYDERGHAWAGHVDESKSFSMLPFSAYRSSRTNIAGDPMDLDQLEKGKEVLLQDKVHNIKGIQAQLFTETIRDYESVEYYIFPKILGLVERGWNAHPDWENMRGDQEQKAFDKNLSRFYTLINDKEIPFLSQSGVNFRLPNPGISVQDGYLYANTSIPQATIHYTADGTEPTHNSPIWTHPVKYNGAVIKACIFYSGKRSLTTTFILKD